MNEENCIVTLEFDRANWQVTKINFQAPTNADIEKMMTALKRGVRCENLNIEGETK